MPAIRTWLKNPLAIFTANTLDARGGLVLQDGLIVEVLGAGQQPSAPCEHIFDAREHVILPGLINTHHHFYQTLTRAWAPPITITCSLMDWKTPSTCKSTASANWVCGPC